MSEITLKVPAEYFDDFRLAAIAEISLGSEFVKSNAEDLSRKGVTTGFTNRDDELADLRCTAALLREDMAILEQMMPRPPAIAGGIEVHGQADALGHMAETMARKIVEPAIAAETGCGPFDQEYLGKLADLTTALGWAAGEAVRLHSLDEAERKAKKATAS